MIAISLAAAIVSNPPTNIVIAGDHFCRQYETQRKLPASFFSEAVESQGSLMIFSTNRECQCVAAMPDTGELEQLKKTDPKRDLDGWVRSCSQLAENHAPVDQPAPKDERK